jgi:hypothetical protein
MPSVIVTVHITYPPTPEFRWAFTVPAHQSSHSFGAKSGMSGFGGNGGGNGGGLVGGLEGGLEGSAARKFGVFGRRMVGDVLL